MAPKDPPRRPHRGHQHRRAAEHGVGAGLPRRARARVEVPDGVDGPEGGRALAGERPHLRHGAAHRHHGLHQRALRGGHQGAAHRRHRLLELGRQVRGGAQVRGLRPAHRARPFRKAGVSARRRRRGRDRGCGAGVGHELLAHRGVAEGPPPGSAAQGRLHRHRGREPGALRLRRQRPAPGRGPLRGRGGDGLEAAQGGGGARHEGGHRRRSRAFHVGRSADQGQALGRPRPPRPGEVRHQRDDRQHARLRGAADPQFPTGAVRGHHEDQREGDARDRRGRPPQPRHQQGLLRLHHRLRAHREDQPHPLHRRPPQGVPARLRRAGVRDRVRVRGRVRHRRHRRPDLRQLHHERAGHGPDLVRRHPRRRDGALRDGGHHRRRHRRRAASGSAMRRR